MVDKFYKLYCFYVNSIFRVDIESVYYYYSCQLAQNIHIVNQQKKSSYFTQLFQIESVIYEEEDAKQEKERTRKITKKY